MHVTSVIRDRVVRRKGLRTLLLTSSLLSAQVFAQSTVGDISGLAPEFTGGEVRVRNLDSGVTREHDQRRWQVPYRCAGCGSV